jgi:hypothetical protein
VIFLKSLHKIKVARYLQEEGNNGKNKSKNPVGNSSIFVGSGDRDIERFCDGHL